LTDNTYDFAVIGAGIAGASVAAELAQYGSVLLLERESQPGYHSTGRSAAMYIPSYGPPPIQALTKASGAFLENPSEAVAERSVLEPRSELLIARADQMDSLERAEQSSTSLNKISATEVQALCPIVKKGYVQAGLLDATGSDIDVHALHNGYLNWFKKTGGKLKCNEALFGLKHQRGVWKLNAGSSAYTANSIVNAAGAWADLIGKLAGAETIGLTPKRRTAMTIAAPALHAVAPTDFNNIPLTADIDEKFYIKPDAGRLLISPANETPMPPCDVQPEEIDIAQCIDQIETAFELSVDTIISKWAGSGRIWNTDFTGNGPVDIGNCNRRGDSRRYPVTRFGLSQHITRSFGLTVIAGSM